MRTDYRDPGDQGSPKNDPDQRSVFDAHARTTDPETSHEAAKRVDACALESEVLRALNDIGDSTSREIASYLKRDLVSISPRMKPLETKRLIRRTGQKRGRAEIWSVT